MSEQQKTGYDSFQFIAGQIACEKGESPSQESSDDFLAGYNTQYQLEQIEGAEHASQYTRQTIHHCS